jgi:putative proteasome-type protease
MTYCVGMVLDHGLVLMSDTRTNSGVDILTCCRIDEQ